MTFKESTITINGKPLTMAQAMTIRVAVGTLAMSLMDDEALGDDSTGLAITQGYRGAIGDIYKLMQEGT